MEHRESTNALKSTNKKKIGKSRRLIYSALCWQLVMHSHSCKYVSLSIPLRTATLIKHSQLSK